MKSVGDARMLMRSANPLAAVLLGLIMAACSGLPRAAPPSAGHPQFVLVRPPSGADLERAASAPAVGVPPAQGRLVWVPDWKLYLREGRDVVEWEDRYLLWADGRWYLGGTDRGPWRPLPPSRPAEVTAVPRAPGGERPPADSAVGPAEDRVVRLATRHVGAPYVWGGADPSGFDCSGLVMFVYSQLGIALPHNAARQYAYGTRGDRDDLRPGDLVFFDRLRHNGIYIGGGEFIHASQEGRGVRISRLDGPWFRERWVGGRRLLGSAAARPTAD